MDQDRRVVVGVDGSSASLAALRWAGREAGLRRARLHVVFVMDPGRERAAPYASCARRSAAEAENAPPRDVWLKALVGTVLGDSPLVTVDTEVVAGLAAKVLISYAVGADLLVLGDPAHSP